MILTIKDEKLAGGIINEINVEFDSAKITVSDIITQRVKSEVTAHNKGNSEAFKGLVQPTRIEKMLNGLKHKTIDAEKQIYVALSAFQKNEYFVLINNVQVESLEQEFNISKIQSVSFVKLTPLVGG